MIRTLRRKFIFISSGSILIIIAVILLSIYIGGYYSVYKEAMSILDYITDNNGLMPDENPVNGEVEFFVSRELRFETRYFTVIMDDQGSYITSNNDHISAVTKEDAEILYTEVLENGKDSGKIDLDSSIFLYRVKEVSGKELNNTLFSPFGITDMLDDETDYKLITFMDSTNRFYRVRSLGTVSLLIGECCFIVFVVLVSVFSGLAVKPIAENYEKQKQFITNAGHELKTPLTVISANTEVIEAMHEKSEWTQSTLHQVERLTGLVNNLITIARLDEAAESNNTTMEPFSVSEVMKPLCDDFRTVAQQQGKSFETDITPDISFTGNRNTIRELISILLDNSVKYCDDGGSISADLSGRKNHIVITVSNTYAEKTDCSRFFDRFYRTDTSHNSKKSGYGIGLSMAETIVRLHKGKISAQQKDGRVCFTVIL